MEIFEHLKQTYFSKRSLSLLQKFEKGKIYQQVVEDCNIGILIFNELDEIVYANQYISELLGYQTYEMIGMSSFKVFASQSLSDLYNQLKQRKQGKVAEYEDIWIQKGGKEIWVQINASPIMESGMFAGSIATILDISSRKHIEIEHKLVLDFYNLIAHVSSKFIHCQSVEIEDAIHQTVKQVSEMCGFDQVLLYYYNSDRDIYSIDYEWSNSKNNKSAQKKYFYEQYEWISKAFKTNKLLSFFDVNQISDSSLRDSIYEFSDCKTLILTQLKSLEQNYGFVGFITWKQTANISKEAISLFTIVGEIITQALERKKSDKILLDANAKSDVSAQAKLRFMANMSHEIRTPLNGIVGATRLLETLSPTAEQQQYIKIINNSSAALVEIIDDILEYTNLGKASFIIVASDFNLKNEIQPLLKIHEQKAREKNIDFKFQYDERISFNITGAANRIIQVIGILLNNAFKFTTKGNVTLRIELIENQTRNCTIEVSVLDTGVGIETEKLNLIFDSFSQADDSYTKKFAGTGLGLAIAKQLVERMEGTINVYSIRNIGSTFSFVITVPKVIENKMEEQTKKSFSEANLSGVKILLAEDHPVNQMITVSILKKWSIVTDVAFNGQLAIEKFQQNRYDLILMDMQMPVMDGLQATKHIREVLKSSVPIIALTANASDMVAEECKAAGMDDYLTKPFEPNHLLEKITKLLFPSNQPVNEEKAQFSVQTTANEEHVLKQKYFNFDKITTMMRNDTLEVKRMAHIFLDATPKTLNELNINFEQGQIQIVRAMAHKIKPSVDLFDIMELKSEVRQIEELATANAKPEEIKPLIEKLNTILTSVFDDMKKELDNAHF